jgi:P4 family phage/plasmid primase-like protien
MDQITSSAIKEDEALPSVLNGFLNYLGRGGNLQYFIDIQDTGQQYKFFKVGETVEIPQWKTVYFSVNPVYEKPENGKASNQDVMAINTLFADMDGKDFSGGHYSSKEWAQQPEDIRDAANVKALAHIESLTPPPSIIVCSGGGYQPYWLFKDAVIVTDENRGQLSSLQARWVKYVGGDEGAKDMCRVLRVPGSINNKYNPPKQTHFIKCDLSITYTVDELERYLPEQIVKTNGNNKDYQTSTLDMMFTIVNAMRYLSSERVDDYHNWIEVGQILKQEIGDVGFSIWKTWSETSNNYHNGDCEAKWDGFGQRDHPRGELKLGTLIFYAEEDKKNGKAPVGAGALPNVDIVDATSGSITTIITPEWAKDNYYKGNLSDTGNAMRFLRKYGDIVRYNGAFHWIVWNGKIWELNSLDIHKYAHNIAREIFIEAADVKDNDELAKKISDWAQTSLGSSRLDNMIEEAKPYIIVKNKEFDDRYHWMLNTQNGIVDLKTGKLIHHDKKYFFTKMINVSYDASATCPKWEGFMEMIFPDEEVRKYIQKAVGYSLTGNSDEKSIFFLWGEAGDNGKSTFIRTLLEFFGDYGKQTDIEVIMETHRGGLTPLNEDFYNTRFVATNEIKGSHHWNDNQLKMLGGGNDIIPCNPKHRDPFSFPPTHKLWIFGNKKPKGGNNDEAFWRRINLIAFDQSIPVEKQRPMNQVLEEFKEEFSGILNWCLQGLQWYQDEGLKQPEKVKNDTQTYKLENDLLLQFLDEECVLGDEYSEHKKILLDTYNRFLKNNQEKTVTKTELSKLLGKVNIFLGGQGKYYYQGVKLIKPLLDRQQDLPITYQEGENTPYWAKEK